MSKNDLGEIPALHAELGTFLPIIQWIDSINISKR